MTSQTELRLECVFVNSRTKERQDDPWTFSKSKKTVALTILQPSSATSRPSATASPSLVYKPNKMLHETTPNTARGQLLLGMKHSYDSASCLPVLAEEPPRKRQRQEKKRVQFNETVMIRERHASIEDLKNSWMQLEEYESIKQDNIFTLMFLEKFQGKLPDIDESLLCTRGLEAAIKKFVLKIELRSTQIVVPSVVRQFKMQQECGRFDDEMLRSLSVMLTKEDSQTAILKANEDSLCV